MRILLFSVIILIGVWSCNSNKDQMYVVDDTSTYIKVNGNEIAPDSEFVSIINSYKKGVDSVMLDIVVVSNSSMKRNKPSGSLDNMVTDAMMFEVDKSIELDIDFAMYNYYGLRRPLPKGEVNRGNVYELLPFTNELTLVHLNPKGIKGLIKYVYSKGGNPLSGINIHYVDSVDYNVSIQGEPLDTSKYYWVATSDYSANGGDKMDFFQDNDSVYYTGILIRDAIFHHFDSLKSNNIILEADSTLRVEFDNEVIGSTK